MHAPGKCRENFENLNLRNDIGLINLQNLVNYNGRQERLSRKETLSLWNMTICMIISRILHKFNFRICNFQARANFSL